VCHAATHGNPPYQPARLRSDHRHRLGTAFGIFVDQIALGAAFGSAIGLLFGAMVDLQVYRRNK
jgi:hypothetical protein